MKPGQNFKNLGASESELLVDDGLYLLLLRDWRVLVDFGPRLVLVGD